MFTMSMEQELCGAEEICCPVLPRATEGRQCYSKSLVLVTATGYEFRWTRKCLFDLHNDLWFGERDNQ